MEVWLSAVEGRCSSCEMKVNGAHLFSYVCFSLFMVMVNDFPSVQENVFSFN